ncbi:MAG: hypothetical protein A4E27_01446 [Methanobacterium sp. PtaU1.Bin242]|nr:MAG: hypothetical protein A4E27_01446 [Methanobacterium sp. PtaU1.Bin242]
MHQDSNLKLEYQLARTISTYSSPLLVSVLVFIGINYYLLKGYDFLTVTFTSIFFVFLLPSIPAYLWMKKNIVDFELPKKEDRFYPLLYFLLSYLIGAIVLYIISAPPITTVLMFCYFSNTLLVLLISQFWKISIHSVGIVGPVIALIYVLGYVGLVFTVLIPLVMWSRVYLKKHSLSQVIAGACMAFASTLAQIYLLIGF